MFKNNGTKGNPATANNIGGYSTDNTLVTIQLTPAELQNLERFHAKRQSRSDDNCVEAHIGFDAARKLQTALTALNLPTTPDDDQARW